MQQFRDINMLSIFMKKLLVKFLFAPCYAGAQMKIAHCLHVQAMGDSTSR
jgi:hypothetical protein